jgi:glycosyltransferase involved in cell wall biosynthesis
MGYVSVKLIMGLELHSPRLCFVGPLTGGTPGKVITQGEILAQAFARAGYPVLGVSTRPNRLARLLDIAWTLWVQRGEIDVQILQVYSGASFVIADLASALGKRLGQKLVCVLHGGNLPEFARRHPAWVRRVLRRADRLVAPSPFLARELEWLGLPVRVIPNHIDLAQYPYHGRSKLRPRLFWMRTFHPIYNPEMAVRVVARLCADVPDIHLTMAGSPDVSLAEVKRLAERSGVAERITFSGFLDQTAKILLASQHDIYLNTNRIDNMPVTVIEMGALGLPVIATRVGGVPDIIIDGVSGLLVPDDDDLAMANAVKRLLSDPLLVERITQGGRKFAESCSWENVRWQWEQTFAELSGRMPG